LRSACRGRVAPLVLRGRLDLLDDRGRREYRGKTAKMVSLDAMAVTVRVAPTAQTAKMVCLDG
jgi:hypothetical protein